MTRPPTDVEILILRRFLSRAGGKRALNEWIVTAATTLRRSRGRPKGAKYEELDEKLVRKVQSAIDFGYLDGVDFQVSPKSLHAAITDVVATGYKTSWGHSPDAVIKRLMNRIAEDPGELAHHRKQKATLSE